VAIREQKQPDAWLLVYARVMLGAALLGQNNYSEAEPLLTGGYADLDRLQDQIPQEVRVERLSWTLERIIALYETRQADGDSEKLQEYKALLDALAPDG
jgi:hypothetical protein